MKVLTLAVAGAFAVAFAGATLVPDVEARDRGYRSGKAKYKSYRRARRAPSTHYRDDELCIGARQKALSELSFRRACEVEEFWRRIEDMGQRGR